jgi:hypothetical protein
LVKKKLRLFFHSSPIVVSACARTIQDTTVCKQKHFFQFSAVRRYGKDFQAMADVLQNKTVSQCRNFFVNHRKRYDLERVLEEYETEQGIVRTDKKDGDEVPSPESGGSSVPSPGTGAQGKLPPGLTKSERV